MTGHQHQPRHDQQHAEQREGQPREPQGTRDIAQFAFDRRRVARNRPDRVASSFVQSSASSPQMDRVAHADMRFPFGAQHALELEAEPFEQRASRRRCRDRYRRRRGAAPRRTMRSITARHRLARDAAAPMLARRAYSRSRSHCPAASRPRRRCRSRGRRPCSVIAQPRQSRRVRRARSARVSSTDSCGALRPIGHQLGVGEGREQRLGIVDPARAQRQPRGLERRAHAAAAGSRPASASTSALTFFCRHCGSGATSQ